jgi:Uma2 family endonuclease
LDELYREEGKAELVSGEIIQFAARGQLPGAIVGEILFSLHSYATLSGRGKAYGGVGYVVARLASGRESFCPDVSYHCGPTPVDRMRFVEGGPTFAVEVRSENDYGDAAEVTIVLKRADYFAAGTLVVWDVDPIAETIAVYRSTAATTSILYRRGDTAEAEPAVPGWWIAVDEVFAG